MSWYTELSNWWDETLDNWIERHAMKLFLTGVIAWVLLAVLGLYICTTTVRTVTRLAAEVHSLQVDMMRLQQR